MPQKRTWYGGLRSKYDNIQIDEADIVQTVNDKGVRAVAAARPLG